VVIERKEGVYMEVRLYMEFGSIRCILRKMDPNYAFVCDEKNLALGHISFENYKLLYKGVGPEELKEYKIIKK